MKDLIIKCILIVNPEWTYWHRAKRYYFNRTGKKLNYCEPRDINEKLMWLTRFWRDPLKTICADKYEVRTFLASLGLSHLSVPLIGVYNCADEIDFEKLPDKFVLKCNHGSGYNIIVLDKSTINRVDIVKRFNEWMEEDFSERYCELHYKSIPRKIVCEELIDDSAPMEYQFWCVNGIPDSILVCRKNHDGSYDAWSYSLQWKQLYERIGEQESPSLEKPAYFDSMLEYAKMISAPFPFIRVDFYASEEYLYLAELTFSPATNILSSYHESFIKRLGSKLTLPPKTHNCLGRKRVCR